VGVNNSGGEAEELTASAGVVVIVEVAGVGRGALEAKRTAAPFRIKRFVIDN
jgi:hypothetical protein